MLFRLFTQDMMALLLLYFSSKLTSALGYKWPGDPRHDTLERFIYEGVRPDGLDMFSILGNCTTDSAQSTTTAATWLRMVYHDSSTFNITDQTGGVDGSIHFELDRAENIGNGLKNTQADYSGHSNKYISMADVIAIGAANAVAICGGPLIPMSGGRVDAKQAGNPGVPEPQQDLQTHIEKFRLQGFNATEMIELVACGHTLGGVEKMDFPTIVVQDNITDSGVRLIFAPFDNTTAFDTTVVTQYLKDTTQNPLVVGQNVTTRSDLRIFNSDGNVTMKALADPATFQRRCGLLIERMINTVPSGVKLTEPIDVINEMPHFSTGLRIANGSLSFGASLRLSRSKSDPVVNKSRISLHWCDRYGNDANCRSGFSNRIKGAGDLLRWKGSPIMARSEKEFRVYPFHAPIEASRSISRFWWEIDSGADVAMVDNEGEKYPVLQDDLVYVSQFPAILASNVPVDGRVDTIFAAIGVRDSIEPTRVYLDMFDYAYARRNPGSLTNETFNLVRNGSLTGAPGYNLYSAVFDVSGSGGATFDFHVEAPQKLASLNFQPTSSGEHSMQDARLDVDAGSVERVAYLGPPVADPPSPPALPPVQTSAPPVSAAITTSAPLRTNFLFFMTITLLCRSLFG